MLWIHPILQTCCLFLAFYVLYMGIQRFKFAHLSIKTPFNWKLHVKLGKLVHVIWTPGALIGLGCAYVYWGFINLTETHFLVGVSMIPLSVIGFGTGLMLQTPKGKRPHLALLHGGTNLVLCFMALYQLYSGVGVIRLFILGE